MTFGRLIIETADGSSTLKIPGMDEHYHSTNGAVTESRHVFIESGLNVLNLPDISVLEVGFGTGLNALLTLKASLEKKIGVTYVGIEKYPLSNSEILQLNYDEKIDKGLSVSFRKMHDCNWEQYNEITYGFKIYKVKSDFRDVNLTHFNPFNLVYFDAFAPNKHPDLWTTEVFGKIYERCLPGAVFVTYCAKGSVRRDLIATGFTVERIPGPPGKREMIRAVKSLPPVETMRLCDYEK